MKQLLYSAALLVVSLFAGAALSNEQAPSPMPADTLTHDALVEALRGGGYVIYLRHTETDPEQTDLDAFSIDDCRTQRNLSKKGREHAAAIGEAIRNLGINVDRVISSPYCRARDTAMLAFGRAETSDDLRFSISADDVQTAVRAAALRRLLATVPALGSNAVVVAHTANLKDATNIWPKPEGVAVIFRPKGNGAYEYVASVPPDHWSSLLDEAPGEQQATNP